MEVISLVDESTRSALDHAKELHTRMLAMRRSTDPRLRECYSRMHELVGDVASIRNATELLKQELRSSSERSASDFSRVAGA